MKPVVENLDPHAAYEMAYTEFLAYWKRQAPHLQADWAYRAIAASAYLAAKGFHLGGQRILNTEAAADANNILLELLNRLQADNSLRVDLTDLIEQVEERQ